MSRFATEEVLLEGVTREVRDEDGGGGLHEKLNDCGGAQAEVAGDVGGPVSFDQFEDKKMA
jgi:hypothetical protein